ncbi:chaperone NapD [Colwellia sp. MEBiC06753]
MNNTCPQQEYHIASFIAHSPPAKIDHSVSLIERFDGAQVHGKNEIGKIVFTIEGNSQQAIAQIIDQIRLTDQFYTISPVYHQFLNENNAPYINKDTVEVNKYDY